MLNTPVDDISLLEESLDRRYTFTEDTVFWKLDNEYNVFFIIDISQSMYSLDPNTNNTYIHTALETLEKCLMGMVQPFSVRSITGLPDYTTFGASGKAPRPGDTFTFTYDPDAPLVHALQIADYFLKIMPEVCSPAFVYLTDGVAKSHFAISKVQEITSSLVRRNTRCTFVQVGSCGGYTPETTFGYVSDSELLFYMAAIQVSKFDRDGLVERVDINLELVWHPNVTVIYRIKNVHNVAFDSAQRSAGKSGHVGGVQISGPVSRSGSGQGLDSGSASEEYEEHVSSLDDRSQRSPNMVEIMIRAYNMFTLVFLRSDYNDKSKGGIFLKVAMLHDFLKSIDDKDKHLRQIYSIDPGALVNQHKDQPPVFVPPAIATKPSSLPTNNGTIPLASRVFTEEIDLSVFMSFADWGTEHYRIYDTLVQLSRNDGDFKSLANFSHVTSMFIDADLISSYFDGINFTEAAKQGQRVMNEFRAHIVMDCLPTFSDSFRPSYRDPNRESVVRATRPLHLLPMDLDIAEKMPSNLLSTRDIGDLHTYVVEWRWSYLAREGRYEDLSGEGSDSEIVRQALHRLALTLGYQRLGQDFTLLNAKGESTGLMHGPDASKYDSCITFFHEREGYDAEELLLACQYQIIVDMKQSSVTARTWIEPWSARFIRMLFEDDFRLLAPLGTFQQILQPERCFQLKVPNIAEFHSRRMNMFSIMAVVNSSRIALRMLQLPEISPDYALWTHPDGPDNIIVDDPTFEITREPDPDEDLEIQMLDADGNITEKFKATEYYKTHDRNDTRSLVEQRKLRIVHLGTRYGERRAILLERFMLTLFDKNDEGKYDPFIEKYRLNEYNPFILAAINPGHPRKLFFNKLTTKWMTTGEFTTVAHRCFLEFALFSHCDAISVNAENFNKLRFASSIVGEMAEHIPNMRQATGIPNGLDEHLYMDKWFVFRLPNSTSFLMVILPNVALSAPNRQLQQDYGNDSMQQTTVGS
ncbi:hypothetical protein GGI11_005985, partial [Coemansia sp. RSA 2049]